MSKLLYKPLSLGAGLVGGVLAGMAHAGGA